MRIPMELGPQSYEIVLEKGVLHRAGAELDLDRKVLVVTDTGVPPVYAKTVVAQCREAVEYCLPMGEGSKSFESLQGLLGKMVDRGFSRKDCVVAVGGGVVGDLSGFAAACYMRGIDFYNIPTTLLSQVDSSIGGKTAIDFHGMKNIVGAFYQPKKVLVDPEVLDTLSPRQLRSGLAEAIKMAATFSEEQFRLFEETEDFTAVLPQIIENALRTKKYVVEQDPKEAGLRQVLNFGHTIGHGIESLHMGSLLHGECVALGMLPLCSPEVRQRLKAVLEKVGLPVTITDSGEDLLPYILHDKKMKLRGLTVVYCEKIGSFTLKTITRQELPAYLESIQ